MTVDIIFKIAGIGLITSIVNLIPSTFITTSKETEEDLFAVHTMGQYLNANLEEFIDEIPTATLQIKFNDTEYTCEA